MPDCSHSAVPLHRARRALATLAAGLALATLAACGGGEAQGGDRGGAPGAGGPGGQPPLPTVAVAVAPAAPGDIATYYRATASLDPDKQADVIARTAGVIEQILAEEGDLVREGQVLLELEDDEYRHKVTLAEVEVERQRTRFGRAEQMVAQGLVADEDFDATSNDLKTAKASLELARLELAYTHVRAPFAGRVVRRLVDPGRNVANGTALFTLADMGRLLARVHVPAKEFRSIRTDQPVSLRVTSTDDRLEGSIDLVSPVVDPETGTVKVTVAVASYPATTRPGDFVEVSIVTDRHSGVLLVPRGAVVAERGERAVFVAKGEAAERRPVEIGFEDDLHAEIAAGLEPGELVVVQGQRTLRDGQPIKVLERLDLDHPAAVATAAETAASGARCRPSSRSPSAVG